MLRIILIEPNKNHQKLFVSILSKKTFDVIVIKDFLVAEQFLTNCSLNNLPDMVIIGYDISDEKSLELIHFIRKNFYFSSVKILKLCSKKSNEAGLKFIDAGADDYLNLKEFTLEAFNSKIENIFSQVKTQKIIFKNAVLCEAEKKNSLIQSNNKFDYMLLDFPDENKVNNYITILKKITHMKKAGLNLCVITNDKIFNVIKSKHYLPKNWVYLIKPLSRMKIFDAMNKLALNIESKMKLSQRRNCKII